MQMWRYVCSNFKRWKSYATYLLKKLGIQRVDILEEISHKDNDEDENQENSAENENKVLDNNSTELVALAKKRWNWPSYWKR